MASLYARHQACHQTFQLDSSMFSTELAMRHGDMALRLVHFAKLPRPMLLHLLSSPDVAISLTVYASPIDRTKSRLRLLSSCFVMHEAPLTKPRASINMAICVCSR